jgi:N12 class adenine-specific DNA methylase
MERVAGIQTGGSERAFDVYMKARYLDEQHAGHGVTFATGTPISNTMVEMYTMQRFLDPEGLRSRGLEHFDAWAATFGEVIDTMEISPLCVRTHKGVYVAESVMWRTSVLSAFSPPLFSSLRNIIDC